MATKPDSRSKRNRRRQPSTGGNRTRPAGLLRSIALNASAVHAEDVFDSLIRYLTKTLRMDYAFVGEVVREDGDETVHVVSASFGGRIADRPSCAIIDTPCREVVKQNVCVYARGVRKLFPKSRELAELEAECYVGVPLFGSSGQLLGVLAVLDRKPLRNRETVELLLQIFAPRAATELERRRLYQDLGESYRALMTLTANLPGMVYRCRNDKDWTLEFVSEGCLALTGYVPDDFVSRRTISYGQLIHPEDREPVWNGVQIALQQNRSFELVYRIATADGELKWVWERGRGVFSSQGELLALEGFVTDITERKRAEEALYESETRLNEAQRIANVGSWELDLLRDHLTWSEEIFRIFEIDSRRFGASYEAFLDAVHPDDREAVHRAYTESVKNRAPYEITHRLRMPDGRVKYVHERCVTYYGESGAPSRSLGTVQDVTERVLAEEALRESERRFQALARVAPVGIFRTEANGDCLYVNERWCEIAGLTSEQARGSGWVSAIHPEDRDHIVRRWYECARKDILFHEECRMQRPDGAVTWVFAQAAAERDAHGRVVGYVGSVTDISERRRVETQMLKLSRALEQTADAVMITDRDGAVEYVNPAFEQVTGYASAEMLGRQPKMLKSGKQSPGFYENMWKTILAGEVFNDVLINRRRDGSLYYEEKTITPIKDGDGRITHFVATGKDITERMQTQERLAYMAQHDPLTELPNRTLLLDRLKQSLAGARWRQRRAAVLFVDLDRFKTINDTLGHEVGDRLLQQLAERFQRSVRDGDTVARFGGDEFVILLDDVASEDDVSGVAQKVLQALAPPFQVERQTLYVTASIGVSLFPNDGDDATTLLKNADIAMYRAKELGKNTYQFYSADMSSRAFERLTLESNLRRALEHGEFHLYYQPQVDVTTGDIVGVEALLRWRHPEFGLVMPSDFIPLLEETGLIVPVGEWALDTACAQLVAWHGQGWPRLRLAVNLSPRQFQTQNLAAAVKQALARLDGDPGRLELEITEGMLVRHAPATIETIEALHALGVRMAIDDFGTGYSSLSYLRRLPIDTLKIDRSFVRDIPQDPDDSAITSAIIALAQSLKIEMIAEGVENAAQRDFLRARGCSMMQGYLFSRPQPAEEITRLLQSGKKMNGQD